MSDGLYGSPVWVRESEPGDENRTFFHIFRDLDHAAAFIAKREEVTVDEVKEELESTWVFESNVQMWVIGQDPPIIDHTTKK